MFGTLPITQVIDFLTDTSISDCFCVMLLDLVVALAKSHLVLVFSVETHPSSLFSFMTALSESLLQPLIL